MFKVSAGGTETAVKKDGVVTFVGDTNLNVKNENNTITYGLNSDLTGITSLSKNTDGTGTKISLTDSGVGLNKAKITNLGESVIESGGAGAATTGQIYSLLQDPNSLKSGDPAQSIFNATNWQNALSKDTELKTGNTGLVSGGFLNDTLDSYAKDRDKTVTITGDSAITATGIPNATNSNILDYTLSFDSSKAGARIFQGDTATTASVNLNEILNIKGGAASGLSENNIGVVANPTTKTLNIQLSKNLSGLNEIKFDNSGVDGVTITSDGIDMKNHKISNLATPDSGTDAVNKSYVDALIQATSGASTVSVQSNSPASFAMKDDTGATIQPIRTTGPDGQVGFYKKSDYLNGALVATATRITDLDKVFISTINSQGSLVGAIKFTNIANGEISTGSVDAINGGQLAQILGVDGNTYKYDPDKQKVVKVGSDEIFNLITKADGTPDSSTRTLISVSNSIINTINQGYKLDTNLQDDTVTNTTKPVAKYLGSTISIKGGSAETDLNNLSGKNLATSINNNGDINLLMSKNPEFDSIKVGSINNITLSQVGNENTLKFSSGATDTPVKLTNLANGDIAENGKDAVTSGQLYNTAKSVADTLGGGASVGTDGSIKGVTIPAINTQTVVTDNKIDTTASQTPTTLADALSELNTANNNQTTAINTNTDGIKTINDLLDNGMFSVSANSDSVDKITKGQNIKFNSTDNITVAYDKDNNTFTHTLNSELKNITSISNTKTDPATGATTGTTLTLSDTENKADLGGAKLTNIADATEATDAVNRQTAENLIKNLAANQDLTNLTDDGKKNLKELAGTTDLQDRLDEKANLSDFNTLDNQAVKYDNTSDKTQITLEDTGGTTITNLKNAELSSTSTEAVAGNQLYTTNQKVDDLSGDMKGLKSGKYSTLAALDENGNKLIKANDGNFYDEDLVNEKGEVLDKVGGKVIVKDGDNYYYTNPDGTADTNSPATQPQTSTVASVGIQNPEKPRESIKFTNLENGKIEVGSKDAIAGDQVAKFLGIDDTHKIDDNGKITGLQPLKNSDGSSKDAPTTLTGAIDGLTGEVNKGFIIEAQTTATGATVTDNKVQKYLGDTIKITGGQSDEFKIDNDAYDGINLATSINGDGSINLLMKKNPKFDSVQVDSISMNQTNDNVLELKSEANDGEVKLTGLASGELKKDSKDAVTGDQLFTTNQSLQEIKDDLSNAKDSGLTFVADKGEIEPTQKEQTAKLASKVEIKGGNNINTTISQKDINGV